MNSQELLHKNFSRIEALSMPQAECDPYIIENKLWDSTIPNALSEWAEIAIDPEMMPLVLPMLRVIAEYIYTHGVKDGLQRASNPVAKLFEKEEMLDPTH